MYRYQLCGKVILISTVLTKNMESDLPISGNLGK